MKKYEIVTNHAMDNHEVMKALCKSANKFGLKISFLADDAIDTYKQDFSSEIKKASNGRLDLHRDSSCVFGGEAWFLFDTENELDEAYFDFVGDDGPTKRNPYDGELRIYALTCGPDGNLMNENT